MDKKITVRSAKIDDANRILEIYSYYVKTTAITFENDPPTPDEFLARIKKITKKYPYLVAECDGQIVGYAYATAFRERPAYDWSVETTIYVDNDCRLSGVGRLLYEELEARLKEMGILNMYACIGYPDEEDEYLNFNSAKFHEHMGFVTVGMFHKCGYKFGRWYNMIWAEKIIGEHF